MVSSQGEEFLTTVTNSEAALTQDLGSLMEHLFG